MDLRALALHLLHYQLLTGHSHRLLGRDEAEEVRCESIPYGLLLDEAI